MPLRPDESDDDDVVTNGKRKRSRPTLNQKRHSDADKATVPAPRPLRLAVGDSAAIEQLYLHRFMDHAAIVLQDHGQGFCQACRTQETVQPPLYQG